MMRILLVVGVLISGLTARLLSAENRTFTAERSAVSIDGMVYPGLATWSGGEPRGVVQTRGNNKQVSSVTYDSIVVEVGGALQAPLLGLVKDFCAGSVSPVTLLLQTSSRPSVEAAKAVLTKVEFPALNGASKEAARILLTFVAPATRSVGATVGATPMGGKEKAALAANFRLGVDGLPSNRIATVSSLVISREAGRTEVSNLLISISSADAEAWEKWRDEFLVQGKNADAQEKSATLTLLDPAMKTALFDLFLSHVGLVRLSRSDRTNTEAVARIEAELYIEGVSLSPPLAK